MTEISKNKEEESTTGNKDKSSPKNYKIRLEEPKDYYQTESLIRDAFWNQLNYLLEIEEADGSGGITKEIVGQITYSHSKILSVEDPNFSLPLITFGPVSISPTYQRHGYGRELIQYSIEKAKELGYQGIGIYGDPRYYGRHFGFHCGERYEIKTTSHSYAIALLILPLTEGLEKELLDFKHRSWGVGIFQESKCFELFGEDPNALEVYDRQFPAKEKILNTPSQLEFKVLKSIHY